MKHLKRINLIIMLLIFLMAACENKNEDPTPEPDPTEVTDDTDGDGTDDGETDDGDGTDDGTTGSEVESTDPLNGAIDVALNSVIKVTFTEDMDNTSIDASTFTLSQGTTEVEGTVAYSSKVASFTPLVKLNANLEYTALISTDVKAADGENLAAAKEWSFTTVATTSASLEAVDLGTAGDYVILAKTAITNNPTSKITGDLGISPAATSYITGFALVDATGYATSAQVTGNVYGADMADPTPDNLTTAVENMITAYDDAAGRPSPDFSELGTGSIGGQTLSAGLYKWTNTVSIPTDITISGGADDVWIFQIAGDLTVSSAVTLTLEGGAQAKNIFWQVAGEVTLGTSVDFKGVILSKTAVTLGSGATYNGRILAQTAVILDGNEVTQP